MPGDGLPGEGVSGRAAPGERATPAGGDAVGRAARSGAPLRGFHLRFGDAIDPDRNAEVHAAAAALLAQPPAGLTDVVPGYASLYLEFDPRWIDADALRARAEAGAAAAAAGAGAREVTLPVRYDGADLDEVAARTGLERERVVARHAGVRYLVYAMGFSPGFPFMGTVDPALQLPRRREPRARVPAHSLAMAGPQTGIYPLASPGGWNLLGHTLDAIYDPRRDEPFRLRPGDRVTLQPSDGEVPPEPEPLELLPPEPPHPALRVHAAGLCDLVVDGGRLLAGRFGLARSGPADAASAGLANRLVGNPADAPLLEFTLAGPELEACEDVVLALCGWALRPERLRAGGGAEELEPFRSFLLRRGERLRLRPRPPRERPGARAYLALAGGVHSRRFMHSASTDLRGRLGRPLQPGDVLGRAAGARARPGFGFRPYRPERPAGALPLRLLRGPQWSAEAFAALTAAPYRVASADRTGVRLAGTPVPGGEVLSEGAPLGALQITSGGSPILLLCDRGTLGGYAKPALLHPRDLPRAGQLRPGAEVRFVAF